jgi:uncharacterized RDD family membrane protein YckC
MTIPAGPTGHLTPTPSVAPPTQPETGTPARPAAGQAGGYRRAGFATRLVAFLLDVVIVSISSVLLGLLISLVLNFFGLGAQQLQAGSVSQILNVIRTLTVALASLATILFVPAYFVVFWTLAGETPGKRVMGLRVMRPDHRKVGWVRSIVRFIGYFVSAIPLFLGFLWVLGDKGRQGWHDKLADTCVVYTWDVPPGG